MLLIVSCFYIYVQIRFLEPLTATAFQVFHTQQGSQGILHHPSHQQLDNVFGTHKDIDVVKFMLEHAKEQPGTFHEDKIATTNAGRGSMGIDTRGKDLRGV